MSNKEILEKAIQKAIDGGWELPQESWNYEIQSDRIIILTSGDDDDNIGTWRVSTFEIIFSHDFAKSLWKSPKKPKYIWQPKESGLWEYDGGYMPDFIGEKWEYHLQQMVISDNPIKYLGENI